MVVVPISPHAIVSMKVIATDELRKGYANQPVRVLKWMIANAHLQKNKPTREDSVAILNFTLHHAKLELVFLALCQKDARRIQGLANYTIHCGKQSVYVANELRIVRFADLLSQSSVL